MYALQIVQPLDRLALPCLQVAVDHCYDCIIEVKAQHHSSLVSQVALEASFDVAPIEAADSWAFRLPYEHQSQNSDQVVLYQVSVAAGHLLPEVELKPLPPQLLRGLVGSQQHVVGVQLHNFLQADHDYADLFGWEVEYLAEIHS